MLVLRRPYQKGLGALHEQQRAHRCLSRARTHLISVSLTLPTLLPCRNPHRLTRFRTQVLNITVSGSFHVQILVSPSFWHRCLGGYLGAQRQPQRIRATAVLSVRTVMATAGVSTVPTATIAGDVLTVYDVKVAVAVLTAWIVLIVVGVLGRED